MSCLCLRKRPSCFRFLAVAVTLLFIPILGIDQTARGTEGLESRASPVELSIVPKPAMEKMDFLVGKPIVMSIHLRNNSKETLTLTETCETVDYKLSVTDEKGTSAPLTPLGKHLINPFDLVCPRKHFKLKSDQSVVIDMEISAIFDMSRRGGYQISASRGIRSVEGKWSVVISPSIQINVR